MKNQRTSQKQRTSSSSDSAPTHEQIALHAEVLWRARGCPQGQDTDIWLEAERQLSEDNRETMSGGSR